MMMEVETGRILKGNDPIEGNPFFPEPWLREEGYIADFGRDGCF